MGQAIIHQGRMAALIDGKIYPVTKCRHCGRNIVFILTPAGRYQPTDILTEKNHFATCPARKK